MRTIPNDDAVAFSVCHFWQNDMAYEQVPGNPAPRPNISILVGAACLIDEVPT